MSFEAKNFIDYFVVCGLDVKSGLEPEPNEAFYDDGVSKSPLERSYKCKILHHFPDNLPWNPFDEDAVTQLCLPKGLVFQKHYSKPKFHPFIITREDGSRVYAGAFTFFELIEDDAICNAMQTLQTMYDAEFSNSKVFNTSLSSASASGTIMSSSERLNNISLNVNHLRSSSASTTNATDSHRDSLNNLDQNNIKKHSVKTVISNAKTFITSNTPVTTKNKYIKHEFSFVNINDTDNDIENTSMNNFGSNNNSVALNEEDSIQYSYLNSKNDSKFSSFKSNSINENYDGVLKNSNHQNRPHGRSSFSNSNNKLNASNNNQDSSSSSSTKPSHFSMIKDRLYASKCICLISQHPFNRSFKKILSTLFDMVEKTDLLGLGLEAHLYNLIYELPMPLNGKSMQFYIGCRATNVYMPDYTNGNDLPFFDYDFFEFFRILGVTNMINLYITALLEHQILLYSKDYYLLMLVAECLTTLFFPFTWLKPYVPIVPASNLHFIEAPVPYIMGFHHRDIDKEFFKQGQRCFVDIDSGTVTCPEGLPEFPDKNKFVKEINDLIFYFDERKTQIRLKNLPKQSKIEYGLSKTQVISNNLNDNESNKIEYLNEFEQVTLGINNLKNFYNDKPNDISFEEQNNSNNYDSFEILQNSQAFARITELARKAGAINNNEEYLVDKITGRLKSLNRTNETQYINQNIESNSKTSVNSNSSKEMFRTSSINLSSGVSSMSSLFNTDINLNQEIIVTSNFNNVNNINYINKQENENNSNNTNISNLTNSNNSINVSNQTDDSVSSTATTNNQMNINNLIIEEEELINMQFTRCVREIFLQKFVQMFMSYEKFVIVPNLENNQIESWWMSREYSGNFDSKMFLIEQPSPRLPFLSHFIATQMFVSFIDLKIISLIDPQKSPDPNVKIFDSHIKKIKETELNSGMNIYEIKLDNIKTCLDIKSVENEIFKNMCQTPVYAPTVHKISKQNESIDNKIDQNRLFNLNEKKKKETTYLFESIDDHLLKADEELIKKIYNEMKIQKESEKKKHEQFNNPQLKLGIEKKIKIHKKNKKSDHRKASNAESNQLNMESVEKATELNPIFIQSLLKESKLKTKRMLVEKMPEVASLGHGEARISGIEENMLIASLCDLIERIWAHGLHIKPGKSCLWNHLINYRKLIQCLRPNSNAFADTKSTSPRSSTLPRKRSTLSVAPQEISLNSLSPQLSLSRHTGSSSNLLQQNNQPSSQIRQHKRAQSVNNSENSNSFPPLKNDLLGDLSRIDKLSEVKTEIGMARAFVRLSLEKKLLADHLRQLLSESELLRALYKRHAFLRQEDEREQFIYHLQSLNVVDYFCFTNYFRSIPTDYSVLIVPSKKFNSSTTSANPYMKLFGSLGESSIFLIPKNTFEFTISCNSNLGPLTTLSIGHDNAGITPKWMIECLFVRNEITGHIHKFPCGRWLGKGVDDDSLERLLIAEPITYGEAYEMPNNQLLSPYANYYRSRSPVVIRSEEKKLLAPAIQEMLGNSINTLIKFFERPDADKGTLTSLMCGEYGLVNSMEQIFTFGYKSYKLFKKLYIWDFFEKASYEFEGSAYSKYFVAHLNQESVHYFIKKFVDAIKSINSTSANYGKDGKFQIFICLACRDSLLADWFVILSKSATASQMYDEYSFLKNTELNKFSCKILSITNQFNFKLENSLTMGIII